MSDNFVLLSPNVVYWQKTMNLRFDRRVDGIRYVSILQQMHQGSDGSQRWEDIEVGNFSHTTQGKDHGQQAKDQGGE